MLRRVIVAAALVLLAAPAAWSATTVILVRHAEKDTAQDTNDPSLSESGRRRATALAHALADTPLDAVVVSQFRRTQETVQPTAAAQSVEATVRDARDVPGTAAEILRERKGQTTLVCGHSNTVPAMLRSLGVDTNLELTEEDYDDLFIVTIDDEGRATLMHLHYGTPSA